MREMLGKQILKNSISFFSLVFIIELIVRFNIHSSFLDWSILRIFISSVIIGILISLLLSLFNKKYQKIIKSIFSLFFCIYSWVEINLYTYMGFFMGIGNAEQGTKVADYLKDFLIASKWQSYLVFIPVIFYLIYIWYLYKKINDYVLSKTTVFKFQTQDFRDRVLVRMKCVFLIILLVLIYFVSLNSKMMQNKLQVISNSNLILSNDNSNLSVSQFGTFVYGLSDLFINVFSIDISNDTNTLYYEENNNLLSQASLDREIDDSAWNYVIDNEKNNTLNKLNNYFINREITLKNEKTGIYEGKNLIVILMESVNYISIDENRYPTIYKLWSEGTSFRNNYSPRNNCSTGNNEMTVMTSLFTINHTCTANKYKNNVYPEAVFNMFNNIGYTTTSYHDYADHYYSRKTIHKNMGSGKYYNASDLGIKWSSVYEEWPSDIDLIKTSVPKFIDEDKFMVLMSSVTTHQPYTSSSVNGDKNLDKLNDTDYAKAVKRYMSKMYELDSALELLLTELEQAGKLEDTVIALFCDHYPYGLTNSQINSVLDYDVNVNSDVDRTPMIIYNAGQEPEIVNDYTSIIDLLPTLLNMFNVDYDPRLYLGHDIFSEYDHRAYFYDGSWQDKVGYYNSSKGKFIPIDEEITYTDEEIQAINNEINTRQNMSALAIKNNYFNYLFKKIDKYNESIKESENFEEIESGE